ncbi:MAG: class I SAM-dependent methyltransferase [Halioglobus sp.]|nr:class I SAM-dependent methyltransferase [Halioglobus sp.]
MFKIKRCFSGGLTNADFIDLCYERILGRVADKKSRSNLLARLESGKTTRDSIVVDLLQSPEFESQLACREAYPAGHFFSALPSAEERARYVLDARCESIAGVDLQTATQTALAQEFATYYSECPLVHTKDAAKRYYSENMSFPFSDAFILYGFIRRYRPRRFIEIGSGFSSAACLDSLDALGLSDTQCWFVEPYPQLLHTLLRKQDARHEVLPMLVQQVDLKLFDSLEAGDILFIDSTHVSKINSDVNHEIFHILPHLKPGVLIHIHDIYWPFDYPQEWISEGRAWNEAYVVRAFLQFNDAFRILYFNSYLHPEVRKSVFAPLGVDIGANDGGSLWIERV